MKSIDQVLIEFRESRNIGDRHQKIHNDFVMNDEIVDLVAMSSVADMSKIVTTEYGRYKLLSLLKESSYDDNIKANIAKAYELVLIGLVRNIDIQFLGEILQNEMGFQENSCMELLKNVVRVARAEKFDYAQKEILEKSLPSEIEIYKECENVLRYLEEREDGAMSSEKMFNFYGDAKEKLALEKAFAKKELSDTHKEIISEHCDDVEAYQIVSKLKRGIKGEYGEYKLVSLLKEGTPLNKIKKSVAMSYDYILSAIKDKKSLNEICEELQNMGVDEYKSSDYIDNVLRIARAGQIDYSIKSVVEKEMCSEVEYYGKKVALYNLEKENDGLQSEKIFKMINMLTNTFEFEQAYEDKMKENADENQ